MHQCINGRGVAMPAGIPAVMHPKYFNIQDIVMKHITGEPGAVRTLSSAANTAVPCLPFCACYLFFLDLSVVLFYFNVTVLSYC